MGMPISQGVLLHPGSHCSATCWGHDFAFVSRGYQSRNMSFGVFPFTHERGGDFHGKHMGPVGGQLRAGGLAGLGQLFPYPLVRAQTSRRFLRPRPATPPPPPSIDPKPDAQRIRSPRRVTSPRRMAKSQSCPVGYLASPVTWQLFSGQTNAT